MRLLLDESIPSRLRRSLTEHSLLPLVPALLRELASLKPKSYTLVKLA